MGTHVVKHKLNNNTTHRTTNNSLLSNSFTSTISNFAITLRSHINFIHSSLFVLSKKLSKLSNIIRSLTIKHTSLLSFKHTLVIFIINIKNTVGSHTINSILRNFTKKRTSNHQHVQLVLCNSHFSMISNNITKYLVRKNYINNTETTKTGKKFHNTIIRKLAITIVSNRTTFIRINSIVSSTYSIGFKNLRFPNPFNVNITSFDIKFIIFINNSFTNNTTGLICKNTFLNLSTPNYMPNFNKIGIEITNHKRLAFKILTFLVAKFSTTVWITLSIIIPIKKSFVVLRNITTISIISIKIFLVFIIKHVIIFINNLLKCHHTTFGKHIIIFNKNIIVGNRKSISIRNNSFDNLISFYFGISINSTKSNPFKIRTSI